MCEDGWHDYYIDDWWLNDHTHVIGILFFKEHISKYKSTSFRRYAIIKFEWGYILVSILFWKYSTIHYCPATSLPQIRFTLASSVTQRHIYIHQQSMHIKDEIRWITGIVSLNTDTPSLRSDASSDFSHIINGLVWLYMGMCERVSERVNEWVSEWVSGYPRLKSQYPVRKYTK